MDLVTDWQPYCGAEFGASILSAQRLSGTPVLCDREVHSPETMHYCSELGFSWYG